MDHTGRSAVLYLAFCLIATPAHAQYADDIEDIDAYNRALVAAWQREHPGESPEGFIACNITYQDEICQPWRAEQEAKERVRVRESIARSQEEERQRLAAEVEAAEKERPRTDRLVHELRDCIATNAERLSSGTDSAYTIASVVVSMCEDRLREAVRSTMITRRVLWVQRDEWMGQAARQMTEEAAAIVLEQRAAQQ